MTTYQIITGFVQWPESKPGPKKGSIRKDLDNREVVEVAATGVLEKRYKNPTDAAEKLIDGFKSNGATKSVRTMFWPASLSGPG